MAIFHLTEPRNS